MDWTVEVPPHTSIVFQITSMSQWTKTRRDVLLWELLNGGGDVPYLLIEDFNTTGLIGDVEQFTDPSTGGDSDDNHFYWFVRNVGRSGKTRPRGWELGCRQVGVSRCFRNQYVLLPHSSSG